MDIFQRINPENLQHIQLGSTQNIQLVWNINPSIVLYITQAAENLKHNNIISIIVVVVVMVDKTYMKFLNEK